MALPAVPPPAPVLAPATYLVPPILEDPAAQPVLSRKRRMNFFDMANLLDSDGNLQNEMLVFAFAATMLSTIPVLLGNEFDVNVGLRRKRDAPDDDTNGFSYSYYGAAEDDDETKPPSFYSSYTYKNIMTSPKSTEKEEIHIHSDSSASPSDSPLKSPSKVNYDVTNPSMMNLIRELLFWSQEKVKDKPLLPMLVNLALDRYHGRTNPADKLVKAAYKKWKEYF